MNGILLINKEENYTSRDVVNIVSKKLHTKKVGHTGTLDPLAKGVLVICCGSATKLTEYLTSKYKEYEAEIMLGVKTDTKDITGNILEEKKSIISSDKIYNVIESFNDKEYMQTVPSYSAVKINGKKLYEYARNNIDIELPKRNVHIKKIELISDIIYDDNKTYFKIRTLVSKGTYIRSLIEDIAFSLNTIGTMKDLVRTKQGNFSIEECIKIDDLKDDSTLISIEEALSDIYIVNLDKKLEHKVLNGAKIDNTYNKDLIAFKYNDKIVAIYKKSLTEENILKPDKMFITNI